MLVLGKQRDDFLSPSKLPKRTSTKVSLYNNFRTGKLCSRNQSRHERDHSSKQDRSLRLGFSLLDHIYLELASSNLRLACTNISEARLMESVSSYVQLASSSLLHPIYAQFASSQLFGALFRHLRGGNRSSDVTCKCVYVQLISAFGLSGHAMGREKEGRE